MKKISIALVIIFCFLLSGCKESSETYVFIKDSEMQTKKISVPIETDSQVEINLAETSAFSVENNEASSLQVQLSTVDVTDKNVHEITFLDELQKNVIIEGNKFLEIIDFKNLPCSETETINLNNDIYYKVLENEYINSYNDYNIKISTLFTTPLSQKILKEQVLIENEGSLYTKIINRQKNPFYLETEYILKEKNDENITIEVIGHYMENNKIKEYETEYILKNINSQWKLSKFELLY